MTTDTRSFICIIMISIITRLLKEQFFDFISKFYSPTDHTLHLWHPSHDDILQLYVQYSSKFLSVVLTHLHQCVWCSWPEWRWYWYQWYWQEHYLTPCLIQCPMLLIWDQYLAQTATISLLRSSWAEDSDSNSLLLILFWYLYRTPNNINKELKSNYLFSVLFK